MTVLKVINDKETWNEIVESFSNNDVYFMYGYFIPFKNYGDGEPHLFFLKSDHGQVAYPFMLRDISESKNLKGKIERNKYFDISAAYGYGGPLFELSETCKDIGILKCEFFNSFSEYCRVNNIISQFDRFHPFLRNHIFFEDYSELAPIRKTVHIDLVDKNILWNDMESKCRQMIRKAQKNNITVEFDFKLNTFTIFKEIYLSTMQRNIADSYYLFNDKFYEDTVSYLENNLFIANAILNDNIIASILVMKSKEYLHGYLGGVNQEFKHLQPTSILYYGIADWGSENGFKKFHVGGGYESESDSLYKFKKTFNRNEPNDFYIGKKIHDVEKYNKLIALVENLNNEGKFFPKYRSPI